MGKNLIVFIVILIDLAAFRDIKNSNYVKDAFF